MLLFRVRVSGVGLKTVFDVHAEDKEQALELVYDFILNDGGTANKFMYYVGEPDNEPQVLSIGEFD